MKTYKALFFISLITLFGNLAAAAQPRRSSAQLAAVISCFTEKEARVSAISGATPLSGNADTLRRLNESLPILKELIACADKGLRIKGLPLNARRSFQTRRKEYKSAEEVFSTQSCIFSRLDDTEKGIFETSKEIDEKDKEVAQVGVVKVENSALQAKLCAERGISSPLISADMKSGFRENLVQITSFLQKIEDFKKDIEKMPE